MPQTEIVQRMAGESLSTPKKKSGKKKKSGSGSSSGSMTILTTSPAPAPGSTPPIKYKMDLPTGGASADASSAEWTKSLTRDIVKHSSDQKLGLKLIDDAALNGAVVVSGVDLDGACSLCGVCVGDVITEVNGMPMAGRQHGLRIIDAAWSETLHTHEGHLRLSLAHRMRDVALVSRPPEAFGVKLSSWSSTSAVSTRFCVVLLIS